MVQGNPATKRFDALLSLKPSFLCISRPYKREQRLIIWDISQLIYTGGCDQITSRSWRLWFRPTVRKVTVCLSICLSLHKKCLSVWCRSELRIGHLGKRPWWELVSDFAQWVSFCQTDYRDLIKGLKFKTKILVLDVWSWDQDQDLNTKTKTRTTQLHLQIKIISQNSTAPGGKVNDK